MDWQTFYAILGVLVGIIGGAYGILRGRRQDNEHTGHQQGVILTELGFIKSGVEEIRADQRELRKNAGELTERIIKVEAKADSAHKRINTIDERLNSMGACPGKEKSE